MDVRFREVDPFNCWIWLRFASPPSQGERNYVDGIFDSWYVIGRLGGFNAENLQVHEEGADLSWMTYDNDEADSLMPALMHNMGQLEYQAEWGRCWVAYDFVGKTWYAIHMSIHGFYQSSVHIDICVKVRKCTFS